MSPLPGGSRQRQTAVCPSTKADAAAGHSVFNLVHKPELCSSELTLTCLWLKYAPEPTSLWWQGVSLGPATPAPLAQDRKFAALWGTEQLSTIRVTEGSNEATRLRHRTRVIRLDRDGRPSLRRIGWMSKRTRRRIASSRKRPELFPRRTVDSVLTRSPLVSLMPTALTDMRPQVGGRAGELSALSAQLLKPLRVL